MIKIFYDSEMQSSFLSPEKFRFEARPPTRKNLKIVRWCIRLQARLNTENKILPKWRIPVNEKRWIPRSRSISDATNENVDAGYGGEGGAFA